MELPESSPDMTARRNEPAEVVAPSSQLHPTASIASKNPAPAPSPKLAIRGLCFFYGKYKALHDVDMDIHEHQVTAFIGPSGCGKSTLLRILNRIYELYPGQRATGKVMLRGRNLLERADDVNLLRAKVGMVFQKPTPFPMSVQDNIRFGVRLYEHLSVPDMEARVHWALQKAALWDEVKDKLRQDGTALSGGQQQRLCISAGRGREAGRPIARRAGLGAGSLVDAEDREADHRAQEGVHDRDRHPQHAASGACLGLHGVHVSPAAWS